jgi:uncharacterized cupin superfamily protein
MVARGFGREDFPMNRSLADIYGYRGIEYGVFEATPGEWEWSYHPKVEQGDAKRGTITGTRETAIATCKAAIDEWLGPKNSN